MSATRGAKEAVLAAALAAGQLRLILSVSAGFYALSVDAALGVVTGRPHWRIYQSRVLGPWLVAALARVAGSFNFAHLLFSFFTLWACGVLALRLGKRVGGDARSSLFALVTFHLVFALLLSGNYLYAWDYLCAITFLVFIDFALSRRNWTWFAGLFLVAIWNRESAMFIALWMMGNPVLRWLLDRVRARRASLSSSSRSSLSSSIISSIDWRMMLAGAGCATVGFGLIQLLRRVLLVEELLAAKFPDAAGRSAQFQLHENVLAAAKIFSNADTSPDAIRGVLLVVIVVIFFGVLGWMALRLSRIDPDAWLGISLVHLALMLSQLVFALVLETRVLVELVPFFTAATVALGRQQRARSLFS